jgi:hypothetical protein
MYTALPSSPSHIRSEVSTWRDSDINQGMLTVLCMCGVIRIIHLKEYSGRRPKQVLVPY